MLSFLDSDQISRIAFNARRCRAGSSSVAGAVDGTVAVGDGGVRLGYRLFPPTRSSRGSAPVLLILKFHGNSELAADYDRAIYPLSQMLASPSFRLALLVVDFRGFGWSDGKPSLTKLGSDAVQALDELLTVTLPKHGLGDAVIIVHGRSIGSVCAARVVAEPRLAARLHGVVIESGLTVIKELPMVRQLVQMMPKMAYVIPMLPDPFHQCDQMGRMPETLPLLVLHGEADQICPAAHGEAIYAAAASRRKQLKVWRSGPRGHNDLGMHPEYHPLLKRFLMKCVALAAATPAVPAAVLPSSDEVVAMKARELKTQLKALGIDASACVERSDYVRLLTMACAAAREQGGGSSGGGSAAVDQTGWALSEPNRNARPHALGRGRFYVICIVIGICVAFLARSIRVVETRGAVVLAVAAPIFYIYIRSNTV